MLKKSMMTAIVATIIFSSQALLASTEESVLTKISHSRQQAINQRLSFLPDLINDKLIICGIQTGSERLECLRALLSFSNEVLSCRVDTAKKNEMANYDAALFQDMIDEMGASDIPKHISLITEKLIGAATTLYPFTKNFPWTLKAYKSDVLNAHAGADAQIMLSAGLWKKDSPLSFDETTAIIAHEVSHVIKDHSLALGCNALEWAGQHVDLALAMVIFRDDFSLNTRRGLAWSEMSQSFEYEADKYATELLNEIGISPYSMGSALNKLRPKEGGGFSSGSHPELDDRIQAANKWADRYK